MKDVETNKKNYTRSERKSSLTTFNKSAVTEHFIQNNHMIDWNGVKWKENREGDTRTRQVKEAIHIKRRSSTMNRNQGAYHLSRTYDPVFVAHQCSGGNFKKNGGLPMAEKQTRVKGGYPTRIQACIQNPSIQTERKSSSPAPPSYQFLERN